MPFKTTTIKYIKQVIAEMNGDYLKHWTEYPCIEWPYSRLIGGYGQVVFNANELPRSSNEYNRRRELAHRLAYEITHPDYDRSLDVCHRCDNPPCFHPAHLFAATKLENMLDKVAKGRNRNGNLCGEDIGTSKLTWGKVKEIRNLAATGIERKELARIFSVSKCTVRHVLIGKTWPPEKDPAIAAAVVPVMQSVESCRPSRSAC